MRSGNPDKARLRGNTLIDRLAVAFGSGVFALVLGGIVWFGVAQWLPADGPLPSFRWVIGFALLMAALGFLLLENLIAGVLGRLMRFLYALF